MGNKFFKSDNELIAIINNNSTSIHLYKSKYNEYGIKTNENITNYFYSRLEEHWETITKAEFKTAYQEYIDRNTKLINQF